MAPKLTAAEAKKAADAIAAHNLDIANRQKANTASAGSEAAVRRIFGELLRGDPNYDLMSDQLGALTRQQLPQIKPLMSQLGALQSVAFKSVGPGGADTYDVTFEHGRLECRIVLGPDGKATAFGMRPE